MAFLDWIKRGKTKQAPEPEDEPTPPRHFSSKGNPIRQQWASGWHSSDDGLHEFRHHVGESVEGYHGGLEVSFRGGDHAFSWSKKRPTAEAAKRASSGLLHAWEIGDQRSERSIMSGQGLLSEWRQDHALAMQRDETGREPEHVPLEATSALAPKSEKTAPKRDRLKGHDISF